MNRETARELIGYELSSSAKQKGTNIRPKMPTDCVGTLSAIVDFYRLSIVEMRSATVGYVRQISAMFDARYEDVKNEVS